MTAVMAAMVLAFAAATSGCGAVSAGQAPSSTPTSWAPRPDERAGLSRLAFTVGDRLYLQTASGRRSFIAGVNLGSTVPGTQPGELAVSNADYRRCFPQMAALGLRAVRVYTILPPSFYKDLAVHNAAHPDAPLYLVKGVWIPEEAFLAGDDLFAPAVLDGFAREIDDAVRAVHGELRRSPCRCLGYVDRRREPLAVCWPTPTPRPTTPSCSARAPAGRRSCRRATTPTGAPTASAGTI